MCFLYLRKYWTVFIVFEKKINSKHVLQIFVEGIKLYWTYSDDGKNTIGKPWNTVNWRCCSTLNSLGQSSLEDRYMPVHWPWFVKVLKMSWRRHCNGHPIQSTYSALINFRTMLITCLYIQKNYPPTPHKFKNYAFLLCLFLSKVKIYI